MRHSAFILAFFLSACAHVPSRALVPVLSEPADPPDGCVTSCGLRAPLEGPVACARLERNQRAILRAYARHVSGWTLQRMCAALDGWKVIVRLDVDAQGGFPTPWGADGKGSLLVLGVTHKEARLIELGTDTWYESALAHELGHVFRATLDSYVVPSGNWNPETPHARWTPLGLCAAINEASWLFDDCATRVYLGL